MNEISANFGQSYGNFSHLEFLYILSEFQKNLKINKYQKNEEKIKKKIRVKFVKKLEKICEGFGNYFEEILKAFGKMF